MTIDELQGIVRILSNQAWVRWWSNFFCSEGPVPVTMAIQVLEVTEKKGAAAWAPVRVADLEKRGFTPYEGPAEWLYVITRTNADGTAYRSSL